MQLVTLCLECTARAAAAAAAITVTTAKLQQQQQEQFVFSHVVSFEACNSIVRDLQPERQQQQQQRLL